MKILSVQRGASTPQGTFSKATFEGLEFDVVELPWKENEPDVSCIPSGSYLAQVVPSAHFGFPVYLILSVPGRSSCEVHPANFGGDTAQGYYTDLLGCMGLGYGTGNITAPNGRYQLGVLKSREAFADFMKAAANETLTIEITPYAFMPEVTT